MAKTKAMQQQRSSATKATRGRGPAATKAQLPDTYEACTKAYRWASKRYRKTLDILAK